MKTCRSCHFLAKAHVDRAGGEYRFSWDDQERADGGVADYYAAECAEGVWSTRIDPGLSLKDVLATNRRSTCFYVKAQEGMSFPAARNLLELHERHRRTRRERLMLAVAVTTSVVALVSTAVAVMSFVLSRSGGIPPTIP